jgi:Rrf2 family protein
MRKRPQQRQVPTMRLTKTTGHAIRILIDCTEANGALLKVADISKRLDITPLNVFKIVHILARADFVVAFRGPNGGVRLARAANTIRIGDIVRAIEATELEVAGAVGNAQSKRRDAKPHLNVIFDDALEAFISVLDQHTLADMASKSRTTVPPMPKSAAKLRARNAKLASNANVLLRD